MHLWGLPINEKPWAAALPNQPHLMDCKFCKHVGTRGAAFISMSSTIELRSCIWLFGQACDQEGVIRKVCSYLPSGIPGFLFQIVLMMNKGRRNTHLKFNFLTNEPTGDALKSPKSVCEK